MIYVVLEKDPQILRGVETQFTYYRATVDEFSNGVFLLKLASYGREIVCLTSVLFQVVIANTNLEEMLKGLVMVISRSK